MSEDSDPKARSVLREKSAVEKKRELDRVQKELAEHLAKQGALPDLQAIGESLADAIEPISGFFDLLVDMSPKEAEAALSEKLEKAGLEPKDIDYSDLHATVLIIRQWCDMAGQGAFAELGAERVARVLFKQWMRDPDGGWDLEALVEEGLRGDQGAGLASTQSSGSDSRPPSGSPKRKKNIPKYRI